MFDLHPIGSIFLQDETGGPEAGGVYQRMDGQIRISVPGLREKLKLSRGRLFVLLDRDFGIAQHMNVAVEFLASGSPVRFEAGSVIFAGATAEVRMFGSLPFDGDLVMYEERPEHMMLM